MRIIGKINKIKEKKAEFIPLDVFPENTGYFKKIKNKKILIENIKGYQEGELIALDEKISHKFLYKKIRKKKNTIFIPEKGKYYAVLENEYMKILIDPEKGGRIDSLLDKRKNFEWFLSNFVYIHGKSTNCGISQGIFEKNLYEKKVEFKITKKRFYGKKKEKDFIFEKIIELNKNKLSFSFVLESKKEKEFYPFFEINIFTGGEIYKYFLRIKKDKKIIELPHLGYPFWVWWYNEDFGKVDEIRYLKENRRLILKSVNRKILNFSFYYGLNYLLNRFYYKKIKIKKGRRTEFKMEIKL